MRWPVRNLTSGPVSSAGVSNLGSMIVYAFHPAAKLTRVPSGENQILAIGDLVPSDGGIRLAGRGTWSRLSAHRASYSRTVLRPLSKNASHLPSAEIADSF